MKRRLQLFYLFIFFTAVSNGQGYTALNILEASSVPRQKFESYISKQGFTGYGASYKSDTIARDYNYKKIKKSKIKDSTLRSLVSFSTKEDFSFAYNTTSFIEYKKIKNGLIEEGFFCNQPNQPNDSLLVSSMFYQFNDLTVTISSKPIDTLTEYSFFVHKQKLPKPKEIVFAEDLTIFGSHEYLRYYFGENNVQKDIYYLSDKKIGKCSILFPNTNRQVVFLWEDETNNCKVAKIFIGGQLRAQSSLEYENNIAENIWQLKSGIRQGMSLYELRKLNEAAFNFYGANSVNTGMVLADGSGKINFKRENIILGCINCNDQAYLNKKIVNSDEAIEEERILFVHTIILEPGIKEPVQNQLP